MTGRNSWVPSIFLGGLLFVAFCKGDALWGFQRAEAPDVGNQWGNAWPGRPIRLTNVSALHDVFNWAVRPDKEQRLSA